MHQLLPVKRRRRCQPEQCQTDPQAEKSGAGPQLQNGASHVGTNSSQRIGASAHFAEIICGVAEATMHDGHDLTVGLNFLRCPPDAPLVVGLDLFFDGINQCCYPEELFIPRFCIFAIDAAQTISSPPAIVDPLLSFLSGSSR